MTHSVSYHRVANHTVENFDQAGKLINDLDQNYFHSNEYTTKPTQQQVKDKQAEKTAKRVDEEILILQLKAKKNKSGFFSGIYNAFSSKDNKLDSEIKQLVDARDRAMENDGRLDAAELAEIQNEFSEANKSLDIYKAGKKSIANLISTVAAIAGGIALCAAAPWALGVTLSLKASMAVSAVGSALGKVLSKEAMLGDDYDMFGKEGLNDALISAAYGATGAGVSRIGSTGLKIAAGATTDVGMNIITDAETRKALAHGDFTRTLVVAGSSILFRSAQIKVKNKFFKVITDENGEQVKARLRSRLAKGAVDKSLSIGKMETRNILGDAVSGTPNS